MAKKAKKRGVKPGTKRGPYNRKKKLGRQPKIKDDSELTITAVHGNTLKVGDKVSFTGFEPSAIPPGMEAKPKDFADCILEIVNSSMDQSTKTAAFNAMMAAANNMVYRKY